MAVTVAQSKILNKLKKAAKGAWDKNKGKEATAKGSRLPSGIVNGVAQLVKAELTESPNKNIPMVSLIGVAHAPDDCVGTKFYVSHFLEGTANSPIDKKIDNMQNDLKLLGAELAEASIDDLIAVLDGLTKEKPFFKFNTWKGKATKDYPDPQVNVSIQGLAADWVPSDETEAEEEGDGDAEPEAEAEGEAEGEEVSVPSKGDMCMYRVSAKGKYEPCIVQSVDEAEQTVTLKRSSDKKILSDIPWDSLKWEG